MPWPGTGGGGGAVSAGPAPAPVADERRLGVGFTVGALVVALAAWSAFHTQSPALTADEVAFGALLAVLGVGGWVALLFTRAPIGRPLLWALALAGWDLLNVLVAWSNGIGPAEWLRAAFPQLVLPSFLVLGWLAAPSAAARRRLLTLLTLLGAAVIVASLVAVRSIRLEDVADLQFLRQFGGDFYAPFTATLAYATLFTRDGRRAQPLALTVLLLLVGGLGLAVSFTRTYWLSTALSLLVFAALLARHRRGEFTRVVIALPALGFVAATAALVLAPANVIELLGQRAGDLADLGSVFSFRERLVESAAALEQASRNPLSFVVGNGLGARFSYDYVHPVSGIVYGGLDLQYIHNYYVYLVFTKGAVGLLLFVALWVSLLREARRVLWAPSAGLDHVALAMFAASANLLLASLTTPQFENFQWPMVFGLLLALAARPVSAPAPAAASSPGLPAQGR